MLLSKLGHAKDREKSIELCQRVKEKIFSSITAQEYLRSVAQYLVPNAVLGGRGGEDAPAPPLCVPIEWVHGVDRRNAAARKGDFGVHQLFKDLRRDTYEVNGQTYHGSDPHGAETIIGKLWVDLHSPDSVNLNCQLTQLRLRFANLTVHRASWSRAAEGFAARTRAYPVLRLGCLHETKMGATRERAAVLMRR